MRISDWSSDVCSSDLSMTALRAPRIMLARRRAAGPRMQPTLSDSLLDYAGQSSPGRRRSHNEDALLCAPELGLWAIADGMGGHQCGEVASSLALSALQRAKHGRASGRERGCKYG